MAKPQLLLYHPQPFEAVHASTHDVGGQNYYFVAATVRVVGIQNLVAGLIDRQTSEAYSGTVMKTGVYWTLGFPKLPAKQAAYQLLLAQTDAPAGTRNLTISVEFTIVAPAVVKPKVANIPISCPTNGSSVSSSFTASGSLVPGTTASTATMMDEAENVYNGVLVTQNVPAGMWAFQFNNLPSGEGYTFAVKDSAGNEGLSIGITVDSMMNPPMPPMPPMPPP